MKNLKVRVNVKLFCLFAGLLFAIGIRKGMAQTPNGDVFSTWIFEAVLSDSVPSESFFMDTTQYFLWIQSQPGSDRSRDSVMAVVRKNHREFLDAFIGEMNDFRAEYQEELATGAIVQLRNYEWKLVPGVRYLYEFQLEIDFRKKKKRPAVYKWVFEAAWVRGQFFMMTPIKERY
jgi:hypothetical protein